MSYMPEHLIEPKCVDCRLQLTPKEISRHGTRCGHCAETKVLRDFVAAGAISQAMEAHMTPAQLEMKSAILAPDADDTEHTLAGCVRRGFSAVLEVMHPRPDASPPSDHYRARGGIEPIDFIESNRLSFGEGSVVKYVARWRFKNGVEDLRKARWYVDRLIAMAEAEGAVEERSGVIQGD